MQAENLKSELKPKIEIYTRRKDFYWQSISIYAVVLIVYALFRGTIDEGTFSIVLKDPIVILLALFIVISAIGMLVNLYQNKGIVVGKDFIIFKSRFREKKYTTADIIRIALGKEKLTKFGGSYRIIKLRIANRRRIMRIRPSSFRYEKELVQAIAHLKKSINK